MIRNDTMGFPEFKRRFWRQSSKDLGVNDIVRKMHVTDRVVGLLRAVSDPSRLGRWRGK